MAMNVTLASMAPSQIKRNRYAMLNQFRRSLSVESEQITRSALYRRQSLLLNGTLLPDRTPCEKNIREPTPVTSSITKESTSFSRPLTSSSRPMTSDSRQRRNKGQRVTINVSGEKYQTYAETLDRFPKTLLGDAIRRDEFFEADENEYFFDRDRHAFAAIIHFYQSGGQVYCPLTVPLHILVSEIKYFELGQHALNQVLDTEDQTVNELPKNRLQREIWKLFEISESGIAANIVTVFSVIVIIFSVGILCIETLPYFKGYDPTMTQLNTYSRNNFPGYPPVRQPLFNSAHLPPFMRLNQSRASYIRPVKHKTDAKAPNKTKPNLDWLKIFGLCETGIVAWFTLEFLVRFLSCPNKLQFMKSCMNIIDLLAIIPYYITLVFNEHGLGLDNIRIIRLVRVFRIFKLSRHSRGLQILGLTLKASIRELGLLIFFLLIGVILFSSAVYYIEMQTFQSIPDAFWWAIITMCTVGYGDKVPDTFSGKLVGSLCAICGVLTTALPVPVIVSNFDYFYQRERARKFHQCITEEGIPEDQTSTTSSTAVMNGGTDFRRQEMIERQKNLKRLESHRSFISQRIRQFWHSGSETPKNNNNNATKTLERPMERESVV